MLRKKTEEAGGLSASLTVEAAVVVSIVLISIASMLMMEFRLHDRLAAKTALYFALESYSYRNQEQQSIEQINQMANSGNYYILNNHPTVELSTGILEFHASGSIDFGGATLGKNTIHVRTENLLRASVLADIKKAIGNKVKEETKTKENKGK